MAGKRESVSTIPECDDGELKYTVAVGTERGTGTRHRWTAASTVLDHQRYIKGAWERQFQMRLKFPAGAAKGWRLPFTKTN